MNLKRFFSKVLTGVCSLLLINMIQAGTPVWTFTPLTATTLVVSQNGTAMVQYQVTNQSLKPHTLVMRPIPGITQITTGAGICGNAFTLPGKGSSCILSLMINGSQITRPISDGPSVCDQGNSNMCYRPSAVNVLRKNQGPPSGPTLTSITPNFGPDIGGAGVTLTGTNLIGTTSITFNGVPATNINVINSTTVTAVTPANPMGAVDVVVTTPVDIAVMVNGYNYLTAAVGQRSRGGTIACLNGSFLNLVAAVVDNSVSIQWGGQGTPTNATSLFDGATNTTLIVGTLGASTAYTAGLCEQYRVDSQGNSPCVSGNACYSDWFLPALDQLDCLWVNQSAITGFSNDSYWTSTEFSANNAYAENFLNGTQSSTPKSTNFRVRCVRSL